MTTDDKPKFTPGPWEVQDTREIPYEPYDWQVTHGDLIVAHIGNTYLEEEESNAALIAAAPEMYQMLQAILDMVDAYGHITLRDNAANDIRGLLAKARGGGGRAMTTLEQLVPPFELCRKIPADAFNGTALVWWWFKAQNRPVLSPRNIMKHDVEELVPAPTAQEILKAMRWNFPVVKCGIRICSEDNWPEIDYFYCTARMKESGISTNGHNLPEALLKLWLDVRRVEREAKNAKHEAT
jgi:hypothetical protein